MIIPIYKMGHIAIFIGIDYDKPLEYRYFGNNCWIFKIPGFQIQYYSLKLKKAVGNKNGQNT